MLAGGSGPQIECIDKNFGQAGRIWTRIGLSRGERGSAVGLSSSVLRMAALNEGASRHQWDIRVINVNPILHGNIGGSRCVTQSCASMT